MTTSFHELYQLYQKSRQPRRSSFDDLYEQYNASKGITAPLGQPQTPSAITPELRNQLAVQQGYPALRQAPPEDKSLVRKGIEYLLDFFGKEAPPVQMTPEQRARAVVELEAGLEGIPVSEYREGSEIPEQISANFVNAFLAGLPGALEKALTGEGLAPPPTTTGGKIGAGIGELGGFIAGVPGGVTKGVAGALMPATGKLALPSFKQAGTIGEKLVNIAMRSIATAGGLGAGYGVRNIGEALEEPTLTEAAKSTGQALSEGAGTGAVFGVAGHIPNRIARIAAGIGMLEAERATDLKAPIFDDRPIEEKVYDIAQSIFFLWNKHGTPILTNIESRVNDYAKNPTADTPVKLIEYAAKEWQTKEVVPRSRTIKMGRGQISTPEEAFPTPDELKPITPQPTLQPRIEGGMQRPAALPPGQGFVMREPSINRQLISQKGQAISQTPQLPPGQGFQTIGEPFTPPPPVKPAVPGPAQKSADVFAKEFATIQGPKGKELLEQRLGAEQGVKPSDSQVESILNQIVPGHNFRFEGFGEKGVAPEGYSFHAENTESPIHGSSIAVPDLAPDTIRKTIEDRIKLYESTNERVYNEELNEYNKLQKKAKDEGHTEQDIRAVESEADSVEPPPQEAGVRPETRPEVSQARPAAEKQPVVPKQAIPPTEKAVEGVNLTRVKEYKGREGDRKHITRVEEGTVDPNLISHLKGEMGEVRGEHRNRTGEKWEEFKEDIKKNGIKEAIFILKDPGKEAVISEGNHRLDAAIELGMKEVPVEIRYFGHSERTGLAYKKLKPKTAAQLKAEGEALDREIAEAAKEVEAPKLAAIGGAKAVPAPKQEPPKPKEKPEHGYAWIDNQKRPIYDANKITRGKNKGKYRVTLALGKEKIVPAEDIEKFPEKKAEAKPVLAKKPKKTLPDKTKPKAVPSKKEKAKKPKKAKPASDIFKSERGSLDIDIDDIKKGVKNLKLNLPKKDMSLIEQWTALPTWVSDKYGKDYKPIQDVIDNRFRNKNIIRNQYTKELLESWGPLSKAEIKKVGDMLWKGDQLGMVLKKSGLSKLNERERKAYLVTREILDYIWFEDRPGLMKELEVSDSDIQKFRNEAGRQIGYMPHPREGRYFVRAKKADKVLHREHFHDIIATLTKRTPVPLGPKTKLKVRKIEKMFDDAIIEYGENTKDLAESAYFDVSPEVTQELLNAAIKRAEGTPEQKEKLKKAMSKAVSDIFKIRGFMSHAVERQKIPGFDKSNWQDAVLSYVSSWAGYKSKLIAAREMWDAWGNIDWKGKERLRAFADKQVRDTFANDTLTDRAIDKARALLFRQFLSGNVKSAALQLTQNYIAAVPRLTIETNWAGVKIQNQMIRAAKDILTTIPGPGWEKRRQLKQSKRLSKEEARAINRARENGIISTQTTDELLGQKLGKFGSKLQKVDATLAWMFRNAELYNRETTFLASFRIGKKQGKTYEQAADFAEKIIDETHFRYGKLNLPAITRGDYKALRAPYAFRHFVRNLFHLWGKLGSRTGMRGKWGLAKSFAALLFFGGAMAWPFIETIDWAYSKITGKSLLSEIADMAGKWSKYALYGAPGGALDIDITGSLGTDIPTSAEDILGAPTEWVKRSKQTAEDVKAGDMPRAVEDFPLMPTFARNVAKAIRLKERGLEKRSGAPVMDDDYEKIKLTTKEAAQQAIGFRPPKLSEHYRRGQSERLVEKYWQDKKSEIVKRWVIARNRGKSTDKMRDEIDDYNYSKPDFIPAITRADLRRRVVPRRSKRKSLMREVIK